MVSFIIPTFNRPNFLVTAIESAIQQTFKCEIIVCDHGSDSSTRKVVENYIDRVKYIRRDIDYGVHFLWLDAIMQSSNDFIHINFDDDWSDLSFIADALKLLKDDVGYVFTGNNLFYEDTQKFVPYSNVLPLQSGLINSSLIEKYIVGGSLFISPGSCLLRKQEMLNSIFLGKIPFCSNYYKGVGVDLLFTLDPLNNFKKVGFIDKGLVTFRVHTSSITVDANKSEANRKNILRAYNDARKFYLAKKYLSRVFPSNAFYIFYKYFICFPIKFKLRYYQNKH